MYINIFLTLLLCVGVLGLKVLKLGTLRLSLATLNILRRSCRGMTMPIKYTYLGT